MKLIVTRLRVPRPSQETSAAGDASPRGGFSQKGAFLKRSERKPPSSRRRKVMTVLLGTAMTLAVCLMAELLPRGGTVPASVEVGEGDGTPLPAVCYAQILPEDVQGGGKAAVPVSTLEKDLLWLSENGYETVSCKEIIDFARGLGTLPEKPVLLVFDGSWQSIDTAVLPLLEQKDMKAAAVISGSDADLYSGSVPKKAEEARLSWNEIRTLDSSPAVELLNGTYDLRREKGEGGRKGVAKLRREGFSVYQAFLADDILTMQNRMNEELSHDASVFCYPFGEMSPESEAVLKNLGFLMTLCPDDGTARIVGGEMDSLYGIPLNCRTAAQESEAFFEKMGLTKGKGSALPNKEQ